MMTGNKVFVGGKPLMNYVTAVAMQFLSQEHHRVEILARGVYTAKAIDISQIVVEKFLNGQVVIKDVELGSDKLDGVDKKTNKPKVIRLSTIRIGIERVEKR